MMLVFAYMCSLHCTCVYHILHSLTRQFDVDFDRDTVLKCGELHTQTTDNLLRWGLNERASENTPGFRLRQHVRCFSSSSLTGGERGGGGGCFNIPTSVHNVQYSVDIGL